MSVQCLQKNEGARPSTNYKPQCVNSNAAARSAGTLDRYSIVYSVLTTLSFTVCLSYRSTGRRMTRALDARRRLTAERCFRVSAPLFSQYRAKDYSRACRVGPRPVISRIVKILRSSQRKGHQPQSPNPPPSREAVTLRSPPATQSGDPSPARHRMNESAAQELDGLQQAVHLCRL